MNSKQKMVDELKLKYQAQQKIIAKLEKEYNDRELENCELQKVYEQAEADFHVDFEQISTIYDELCEAKAELKKFDFAIEILEKS